MSRKRHLLLSDLQPLARLGLEGVLGATDLTEDVHRRVAGTATGGRAGAISRLVYGSIRGVARLAGGVADAVLGVLPQSDVASSPERENVLAALNGVLGDRLGETGNTLALPMRLRREGEPREAPWEPPAVGASSRVLLMVHGLCLNDLCWPRPSNLAQELGFAPIYVHYNSGLHISTNGSELARRLEDLVDRWPVRVEELTIVAHSMGGLVTRSAMHAAEKERMAWLGRLDRVIFLGTPHHGAPLERIGSLVHSLLGAWNRAAPLARLGALRSAGITDLRHGSLLDEDWQGHDRFARGAARPRSLPLPTGVECFALAGSTRGPARSVLGDGLVPVMSALGDHREASRCLGLPASHRAVVPETGHLELLRSAAVEAQVKAWLELPPVRTAPARARARRRSRTAS